MSITPVSGYGTAKFIVSTVPGQGTHTTLAAAMAAASAGDTIFLRTNVTENVTITPGVNISAWLSGPLNTPTIIGTLTMSGAGTSNISRITLQTNSAPFLIVSGSAASIINLNNCFLNCTNNTGITYTSSSSSSQILITNCSGNIGTTGISLFSSSSAGSIAIDTSMFSNTGGTSTASTISSGVVNVNNSTFTFPIDPSSTGAIGFLGSTIDTSAQNVTSITTSGTGNSTIRTSVISSGTASSISVGSGTTVTLLDSIIASTNTNAITGAGTLGYVGITFSASSQKINTTTQTGGLMQGGQTQAPSAGFIGQQITNSATAVATASSTPITITSISLTPGIWDISSICSATATGGAATMTTHASGIGTVNNTLSGTLGIDYFQTNVIDTVKSSAVPQIRATLTATTTYYLVAFNTYASTTCPTNGRITATRVG